MIKISVACDYLGKVIVSWFRFVDDVEFLLKTLLDLRTCDLLILNKSASSALLQCGIAVPQSFIKTMGSEALRISSSSSSAPQPPQSSKAESGSSNGSGGDLNNHDPNDHHSAESIHSGDGTISPRKGRRTESVRKGTARRHEQALMCIINLVQKYPQVLLKHIPLLVSTIIRCLDPSAPRRRKALLSVTTASLHVLVTKYPNVVCWECVGVEVP